MSKNTKGHRKQRPGAADQMFKWSPEQEKAFNRSNKSKELLLEVDTRPVKTEEVRKYSRKKTCTLTREGEHS